MAGTQNSVKDIIVTTPKNKMAIAEGEARHCIEAGGGFYFRTFRNVPCYLGLGSRIFYVEDGYIRGFSEVHKIKDGNMQCGTTGYDWGDGIHAIMPAYSWKWIQPIKMKGFQGWKYFDAKNIKVIGGWLDIKPSTSEGAKIRSAMIACKHVIPNSGNSHYADMVICPFCGARNRPYSLFQPMDIRDQKTAKELGDGWVFCGNSVKARG